MLRAALFTMAPTWTQPRCPPMGGCPEQFEGGCSEVQTLTVGGFAENGHRTGAGLGYALAGWERAMMTHWQSCLVQLGVRKYSAASLRPWGVQICFGPKHLSSMDSTGQAPWHVEGHVFSFFGGRDVPVISSPTFTTTCE